MASTGANNPSICKFIDVQQALKGASYPASKDALLKVAKQNDADEDAMEALAAMADDAYADPAQVSKAVGNEG